MSLSMVKRWFRLNMYTLQSCSQFNIIFEGRRYARWYLLKDKLFYLILFIFIIVWFEWMMHSQVFQSEVIIKNTLNTHFHT